MLLSFLRFLRGYVRFSVSGRYPERFINITARNSIRIWNVARQGDGFTASMYMADYLRIRALARGSGVRLRILSKGGLPTYLRRYQGRVGVVIGACVFILTVFIMSLFIWSIDITGLDSISRYEMQSLLQENGLYIGAFKPALDFQRVARSVMLQKREVGWMAVNVIGSYASVEVKEEAQAPEVPDRTVPCNVKARCDGLLLSIEAEQGTAVVKEGSGVIAGQLIVSGVMEDERGGVRLEHAQARVLAQTQHQATFSVPDTVTGLFPDGETVERKSYDILGLRLPYQMESVSAPHSYTYDAEEAPAPLDIRLPLGRVCEEVYALSEQEHVLDDDAAMELLQNKASLYELFALADCTVTARDSTLRHSGGVYTLYVDYTCTEDIAYTDPIGTDENTYFVRQSDEPTEAP